MPVFDQDPGLDSPEAAIVLPWNSDPVVSWLAYEIWLECRLDAGMVRHKPLPQAAAPVDTLAAAYIDRPKYGPFAGGTNVGAQSRVLDVIQRMATSTYRFLLRGYALRAGYQVPIPGLVSIAGQPAVPDGEQWGYNRLVANWNGIPVFFAAWSLPYMVAIAPASTPGAPTYAPVPANPALRMRADVELPDATLVAVTTKDERAQSGSVLRTQ